MTRDEILEVTESTITETRQRLHAALAALIDEEPDHTLQSLLDRFEQARGDETSMHTTLDLADFCAHREIQSASIGQPSIRWARAKRSADHLAACYLHSIEGCHTEAMTHALAALERALWVRR
jgi:hypothetical protein